MDQFYGHDIRPGVLDKEATERFLEKIAGTADDGHWWWTAGRVPTGYGSFSRNGKSVGAHRVAYDLFVGDLDPGLTIDHLCFGRACVRPDHLEQVTREENSRRAWHRSQWYRDLCRPGIEARAKQQGVYDAWKARSKERDALVPRESFATHWAALIQCPLSRGEAVCAARQEVDGIVTLEGFRKGDGFRPNCTRCNATTFMNREHCERCEAHFVWLPRPLR